MNEKIIKLTNSYCMKIILSILGGVFYKFLLPWPAEALMDRTVKGALSSLMVAALLFAIMSFIKVNQLKIRDLLIVCLSFCFSFIFVVGKEIYLFRATNIRNSSLIIALLSFTVIFSYLFWGLFNWLQNRGIKSANEKKSLFLSEKKLLIVTAVILFVAWLPSWLANWPGTFTGDALHQYNEFLNHTVSRSFPVFHTYYIGILFSIGKAIFKTDIGMVAFATFIQLVILSLVFSYLISFAYKKSRSLVIYILLCAGYGFLPVMQLFVKDIVRDVLFYTFVILFTVLIYRLIYENKSSKGFSFALFLVTFFMSNLRNVAIIFVVFYLGILLIKWLKDRSSVATRSAFLLVLASLIFSRLFALVVVNPNTLESSKIDGVANGGIEESLSVPIQQIARVGKVYIGQLPEEETAILDEIIPHDYWWWYKDNNVDLVKSVFDEDAFDADPMRYIRVYLTWARRYSKEFLNAALILDFETWYPDTVFDGYIEEGQTGTLYYTPGNDITGNHSLFPALYDLQCRWSREISFSKVPFVCLLFSPAFAFYILLVSLTYLIYTKSGYATIIVPAVIIHIGTFFCPVVCIRYNLLSFMMAPVALAFLFISEKINPRPNGRG